MWIVNLKILIKNVNLLNLNYWCDLFDMLSDYLNENYG